MPKTKELTTEEIGNALPSLSLEQQVHVYEKLGKILAEKKNLAQIHLQLLQKLAQITDK